MKAMRALFTGLLVVLAVIFVVQNSYLMFQRVTFRLNLIYLSLQTYPLPLYAYFLIVFFLGVLWAVSYYLVSYISMSRALRAKAKETLKLKEEIEVANNNKTSKESEKKEAKS